MARSPDAPPAQAAIRSRRRRRRRPVLWFRYVCSSARAPGRATRSIRRPIAAEADRPPRCPRQVGADRSPRSSRGRCVEVTVTIFHPRDETFARSTASGMDRRVAVLAVPSGGPACASRVAPSSSCQPSWSWQSSTPPVRSHPRSRSTGADARLAGGLEPVRAHSDGSMLIGNGRTNVGWPPRHAAKCS